MLLYTQHEGSGLTLTLQDIMGLPWRRCVWLVERLQRMREEEAAALKKAYANK